ncbi:hypothetical protein [Pyrococcus kukulkanii]|uniref:hypothetical protein n=1 Tax=Pyrococcus kukulkanii TaxID=1609559 RepID=UPI003567E47F
MTRKYLVIFLVTILVIGSTTVGAMNYLAGNKDGITRIFGYDVYRIEGSGKYIIYYPLPNGSVKVLKRGRAGGFFSTFVKVPRYEWVRTLLTGEKALYAPPPH